MDRFALLTSRAEGKYISRGTESDGPVTCPHHRQTIYNMAFGLRRKPRAEAVQDNSVLTQLLKGRDTRWYAGDLLKINLIIVSCRTKLGVLADMADVFTHHIHE